MDPAKFFAAVRDEFGSLTQSQVDGFNVILDELAAHRVTIEQSAYILATAWHETGRTMQPLREANGETDLQTIRRLDNAWNKGNLPQVKRPYWRTDHDGHAWFGRGFVQLTHKFNYERAGDMIGVDLVGDPDLAVDPQVAAKILVQGMLTGLFTGKKLSQFIPDHALQARQVINGMDRAADIAGYAMKFERALRASA